MKWFLSQSLQTRLIFLMTCMLLILSVSSFGIIRFVLDTNQKNSENNFQNYAHILEYGIAAQFYERYGDIQAFAVNPIVSSLNTNQIPKALNDYVRLYGIYDVILVVDKEGRFIASSTVDTDGKPVDTSLLAKENFKNTNWFQAVLNNQTTDDKNKNFSGTFVEDPGFDSIVEKVYRKKSYGSGFSSAIKNEQGEVVGVITNRANAKWFANEFVTTFQLMKKQGLESMELAMLDKNGTILFEYDPVATNSDQLEFNEQVLGKLNLKSNGVEGAKLATEGKKGFVISKHFRKQIDQASSYSPVDEDKFVNSLGWSVLVRENMDVVYKTNIVAKRFFYITFVIILGFSFLLALYFSKSLASSITRIADNLTNTSKIISSESEKIASSSLQLSSSVSSTASAVDETVSAATEVTEMVGRSAELADQSSKEIEKMLDLSANGQLSIKSMNTAVQAIAESSQKIIHQIDQGNLEIEKIIGLIDEISTKTKVIDDIVFQTRLLSFNASVEAARAGENGKGFAVVAEEVGKLAQMSGQQSKEIAELLAARTIEIKDIIYHSKQATEVLANDVNAKIEVGIETADDCLRSFEKISDQCDQISKMSQEISSSSKEQSIGVRQIADAMSSIGVATNESSQISNQSSKTSVLIKEESQHLNVQIQYLTKLVHGKNESVEL